MISQYASGLKDRWNRVLMDIRSAALNAGRSSDEITLVAVSKTHPFESIKLLHGFGQLHFGENRVQELVPKMESGGELATGTQIKWHMIGTLQTNKIKYLASRVDWIHSVPKLKALEEIDRRAAEHGRSINTLIQVNISDEEQKSGCDPDDLKELLLESRSFKHLKLCGLMGMASLEADPEVVRPQFRLLRELRDMYTGLNDGALHLNELSMGMSHDLSVAIEEGATMVRIGTAIFGERE